MIRFFLKTLLYPFAFAARRSIVGVQVYAVAAIQSIPHMQLDGEDGGSI